MSSNAVVILYAVATQAILLARSSAGLLTAASMWKSNRERLLRHLNAPLWAISMEMARGKHALRT
jgi:hypothetical protein